MRPAWLSYPFAVLTRVNSINSSIRISPTFALPADVSKLLLVNHFKMKSLFLGLLIIAISNGCIHAQQSSSNLPEEKMNEVPYGSFPSSKMDVRLPANRNPKTPFAIIIHGGAWTLGDKVWGSRTQDTLLAHGIASVNINYRYADDYSIHYQQLLDDIDSVINYCINNADAWHTRKTNFIINGESAGAHLALMYGYTRGKKISTIIAFCAPTNLSDTTVLNYYARKDTSLLHAVCKMTGDTYIPGQAAGKMFATASPVTHVKNVPMLFFHGTADPLVPYSQAIDLDKILESKGYPHKLVTMPGAGHDIGLNTPEGRQIIYAEMLNWINQYGK